MLRDYQIDVKSRIEAAHADGLQNVLGVMPCGAGKTVVMRSFAEECEGDSLAIAHRQELVSQMSLNFARAGLSHRIIAPDSLIRDIIKLHVDNIGKSFVRSNSPCMIASVDTLIRREIDLTRVKLYQTDEAHHLIETNKWGRAVQLLNDAGVPGIGWTATPVRMDRKSLKRGRGGVFDAMVVGPTARELIHRGHLTDYRLYGLPQRMDMSHVRMRGGDFDARDLGREAKASAITGDIVQHYKRLADGLTGITFAVDVEMATEHAAAFREAGVPAAVVSAKTPATERVAVNRGIRNGTLLQVVNVDILGEGADFPNVHVVSMARPTMSLGLYIQQSMRPMRPDPSQPGKLAVLLDHVGNVQRHSLPDAHREWTLDTPEKRTVTQVSVGLQICGNPECMLAYEGFEPKCPFCGWERPKGSSGGRERPEQLDGDLVAYDDELLAQMRGEVERIQGAPILPAGLNGTARAGAEKKWKVRADAQAQLQVAIDQFAGYWVTVRGDSVRAAYRRFKATFGVDVLTAQLGTARELEAMRDKVLESFDEKKKIIEQWNGADKTPLYELYQNKEGLTKKEIVQKATDIIEGERKSLAEESANKYLGMNKNWLDGRRKKGKPVPEHFEGIGKTGRLCRRYYIDVLVKWKAENPKLAENPELEDKRKSLAEESANKYLGMHRNWLGKRRKKGKPIPEHFERMSVTGKKCTRYYIDVLDKWKAENPELFKDD